MMLASLAALAGAQGGKGLGVRARIRGSSLGIAAARGRIREGGAGGEERSCGRLCFPAGGARRIKKKRRTALRAPHTSTTE